MAIATTLQPGLVLVWGLCVLGHPNESFTLSFSILLDWLPPDAWAIGMIGLGCLLYFALYKNQGRLWRACLPVCGLVWWLIALGFAKSGVAPTAVGVYSILGLNAFYTFFGLPTGGLMWRK